MLGFVLAMATQATAACAPQPLPPAIEAAGARPVASELIEFAATPSRGARAWVFRLARRGTVGATVEVVRLRRQLACNRYDVEARWRAPLTADEYRAIAARLAPVGIPPTTFLAPSPGTPGPEMVLDGTGLDLRLSGSGWEVRRSLNFYGPDGAAVSAVFRDLAVRFVPRDGLPEEDWRSGPG